MRRHRKQHLRGRKRNVQEKADAVLHARRAQRLGERYQVIVVDPDHVVFAQKRHELLREPGVHAAVAFEIMPVVLQQIGSIVEGRPQRRVRKTTVVLVVIPAHQRDGRERHGAALLDLDLRLAGAQHIAAPAEPHAAGFLQRVVHAHCQTARSRTALRDRRDPVRNDNQSAHEALSPM